MKRSLLLAFLASLSLASTAAAAPKQDHTVGDPHSPYAQCDNFDPAVCLQPFPNNLFTKKSDKTDTGLKVHFAITSMPRNVANRPIQPTQWNRNDGFSPGSEITTFVPGLDLSKTNGVPINNLGLYKDTKKRQAAVVVIDADTLQRNLIWTEMDSNASSDSVRNLIIRPAKNFQEGHTYIVALRDMKDKDGHTIPAGDAFRGYRDGTTDDARSDHMDWIFWRLEKAGIKRNSLYLAWDFTVASERNLTERMLTIRNDAFRQLGDTNLSDLQIQGSAPSFKVTHVDGGDPGTGLNRVVYGTFQVPCYISTPTCQPGGGFVYMPGTNDPIQIPGNTYTARFRCNIPDAALQAPGTASLYGHGLFGSTGELGQDQLKRFGSEHDFVFCGTTWAGMGCELDDPPSDQQSFENLLADVQTGYAPANCDIPNVVTAISDLSRFHTMIDRVQEGMLAFLYLGRLMAHPDGLVSDPAFQNASGAPVIQTGRTVYDGNSQGGIIGGSLAALMVDGNRASIGVPGMNYSTLLQRSTDFGRGTDDECPPNRMPTPADPENLPSYACLVYHAYPNEQDRQVVFGLMQMLWDRGEADGYAWHMTGDPLPGTPAHHVLMNVALGDHQVSNWAAAVEARTLGAKLRTPTLDTFRDPSGGYQYFGEIPAIPSYPYDGSAITVWDSGPVFDRRKSDGSIEPCDVGTAAPLFINKPVFAGCGPAGTAKDEQGGADPHELVRRTVADRRMKAIFLRPDGVVTDQCGGQPCHDDDYSLTRSDAIR